MRSVERYTSSGILADASFPSRGSLLVILQINRIRYEDQSLPLEGKVPRLAAADEV